MAYTSKFTGPEIDQRLTQGTYDDAVNAGFVGSKEQFDALLGAYSPTEQEKVNNKQDKIDNSLITNDKTIVGAINLLETNKQNKEDNRLSSDNKNIIDNINNLLSNVNDLTLNKQNKKDNNLSTENKDIVNAINELNRKIIDGDNLKQNIIDSNLDTNDETIVGAINEIHTELNNTISEYNQHIDDYVQFKAQTNTGISSAHEKITNLESEKQNKTDLTLLTNSKEIVGSINELFDNDQTLIEETEYIKNNTLVYTDISDEEHINRKSIVLNNNDTISSLDINNTRYDIINLSKESEINIGNSNLMINLLGFENNPKYNSDTLVLTSELSDLDNKYKQQFDIIEENITTINQTITTNLENSNNKFSQIDTSINDEIKPQIQQNHVDIGTINENLTNEINSIKPRITILEGLIVKEVTPDSDNYVTAYELQDNTGKVYGDRINITKDKFIKSVNYSDNQLILTFILENGTESTQSIDLSELVDTYLAGTNILFEKTDAGTIISSNISDATTLQSGLLSSEDKTYIDELKTKKFVEQTTLSEYATITQLNTKVDKIEGKQLSTEDFTTEEKQKLASLTNVDYSTEISNLTSQLNNKQDVLVSGDNIRTLNGVNLLGSGDIQFQEGIKDYTELENKPSINNISLNGNITFDDLGLSDLYQLKTDNNLLTTNKTIINAINELDVEIGDLSTLETTNKNSLVEAINELFNKIDSIMGMITG